MNRGRNGKMHTERSMIIITLIGMGLSIGTQIVTAGQNTVITSGSTNFSTNKAGTDFTDNIINDSLILTNTGDVTATVSVNFTSSHGGIFGMVNGTYVIGASNFSFGSTVWNTLNDNGTAAVLTDKVPAVSNTHYEARARIPPGQPALDYVGIIEVLFS
jgi:hypothetical protein